LSTLTVLELRYQTGAEHVDVIIQEIIDQAEGEINGWVELYELDAIPAARLKRAAALLAKAGVYERRHLEGSIKGDSGGKYYNLDKKADQLREAAKALIIPDATTTASAATTNATHYVLKVNA
jgi:hypothetical protein